MNSTQAPANTIVFEIMPWDLWNGQKFIYGSASHYLSGTGVILERVRSVRPPHPSAGETKKTNDTITVDLKHLAVVAAKAKARLAAAARCPPPLTVTYYKYELVCKLCVS